MKKENKIDVLHVVRTFGDRNQPYTTKLLDSINGLGEMTHAVVSDITFRESESIEIKSVSSKIGVSQVFSVFYLVKCFFNRTLYKSVANLSLKKKVKFFLKWKNLFLLNPKVIHLHHLQVFDIHIINYLKEVGVPIVASLRGRDILINTRNVKGKKEFLKHINAFDHIHVISLYLKQKLTDLSNIKSVTVVYRGGEMPSDKNIKNNFKIRSNTPIRIITVGRLVWEKGHVFMFDSIKRLVQQGFNIKLDIYGDGPFYEFLEFRISQLGLQNNIELKGHVNSQLLQRKYKEYDFSIQPSLSEALSNGLLDLAFHNIPCIISDVGGMPEIIKHNVNGLVYDIQDSNQLDHAIKNILNLNFEKLNKHNEELREKFSLQNEVSRLESIYTKFVS